MAIYTRISGFWKQFDWRILVAGTWRKVLSGHVRVGGVWKQIYSIPRFVSTSRQVTLSSTNGINWSTGTLPISQNRYQGIAYGNDRWVTAAGDDGQRSQVTAYSSDGITWTRATMPANENWVGVSYGNGIYFAATGGVNVAPIKNASTVAATSTDGITWTQRSINIDRYWYGSKFGGSYHMVFSGNNVSGFSPQGGGLTVTTNGINWSTGVTTSVSDATYGKGTYVGVGYTGAVPNAVSSTNGTTWTSRSMPSDRSWFSVDYGNNTFVAVSLTQVAAYSSNGTTWTSSTLPSSRVWFAVSFGDGIFMTIARDTNISATSTDGITWTQRSLPATAFWLGNNFAKTR
jgi:hypothetical protein